MMTAHINDDILFNFANTYKISLCCNNITNKGIKYLKNVVDLELIDSDHENIDIIYYDLNILTNLRVLRLKLFGLADHLKLDTLPNIKTLFLHDCWIWTGALKKISINRDIYIIKCKNYTNDIICEMKAKTIKICNCKNITRDVQRMARNKNIDVRYYDNYSKCIDIF